MNLSIQVSNHRVIVFSAVAFLSSLFSLYSYFAVDVINNDGILYIVAAEEFLAGGYTKAMAAFGWPFFPIVIAWTHQITGLALEASAYVVNAVMLIIASMAFVRVYEEISFSKLPLWIPALVVLTLPMINEYRVYVVRGHGYWAFSMLALLFFIIYYKKSTLSSALFWQMFAILGILFRIEGVVFVLFAPFYYLFSKEKRGAFFYHYFRLNSIILPSAICAAIVLLAHLFTVENSSGALQLRLSYMMPSSLFSSIKEASVGVGALMPRLSSGEAVLVSASGIFALVVLKLVKNINLLYLLPVLVGYKRRWIQLSRESGIVMVFFTLSVLPLFVIAGNKLFVSSRYMVLPTLIFGLIISQYAVHLFYKLKTENRVIAASALFVLVVLFFFDAIIHTGAIKGNIVSASEWVIQNIEPDAKIACNNKRFVFYSKNRCVYKKRYEEYFIGDLKKIVKHESYSHLLLWVKRSDSEIRDYLDNNESLELLKTFDNKKGDEAMIYRIGHHP